MNGSTVTGSNAANPQTPPHDASGATRLTAARHSPAPTSHATAGRTAGSVHAVHGCGETGSIPIGANHAATCRARTTAPVAAPVARDTLAPCPHTPGAARCCHTAVATATARD